MYYHAMIEIPQKGAKGRDTMELFELDKPDSR